MIKKFYFTILFIFIFINCIQAFSINPGRIYKNVTLNQKVSGEFQLLNNENTFINYTVEKIGSANWFILDKMQFVLKPNETKIIKYDILVQDANLKGEQQAKMRISQTPYQNGVVGGGGSSIETRLSLPIYINIEGTDILDYQVNNFDCNATEFTNKNNGIKGCITTLMDIKNTGNLHFICEPLLIIYKLNLDNKKELLGQQTLPYVNMLFPNEMKKIDFRYYGIFQPGEYVARTLLYIKYDEDLKRTDEILKKERLFDQSKRFQINKDGNVIIEQ